MLGQQLVDLAVPHAMLARTGALHLQRPRHQPLVQPDRPCDLVRIVGIEHHIDVKISIPDMADNRSQQAGFFDIGAGFGDTVGKPRNRHAHIRGPGLCAGPQLHVGIMRIVPGLP